ncbi:hypothetical protein VNO80_04457 [Phaseolus coccineus]|uniref:Uncharacterized protein n=1 Tax=Phaseolus coccineus TaxID=3886 RepID=A0AAN9NTN4_PHACN
MGYMRIRVSNIILQAWCYRFGKEFIFFETGYEQRLTKGESVQKRKFIGLTQPTLESPICHWDANENNKWLIQYCPETN